MDIGIVSMRYAKAWMAYAKSNHTEEKAYNEMVMLLGSFERQPGLLEALQTPITTVRQKYALICAAILGHEKPRRELSRFITLVLRNKREDLLPYIAIAYIELYRKERHIGVAKLTTAVPIDASMAKRLQAMAAKTLHATDVEIQMVVDPAIEGGFLFDINGYRLDASIATQFKKVRKQFIDRNRRIV